MEKWVVASKRADFKKIGERFNIDQVTARIIRNRDVIGEGDIKNYLYGTIDELYSPMLLKGMKEGVSLLLEAVSNGEKIRIIGDYDIDGVMSTYILHKGLERVGAKVDYMIPHRIHDGYGINIEIVEQAYEDGIQLLITCDNGISALKQIERAKELGMKVIVTDHHEVPFEKQEDEITYFLPPADVIINPKQPGCNYPFREICGAVVAYKFICGIYQEKGLEAHQIELLEFAAFATIGDVMDLVDENRIIVKEGLKRLRSTKNHGIQALILVNNLVPQQIDSYHIGFVLGPCMNASGRLETAKLSLELLESLDSQEAKERAERLKALNDSRKQLTQEGMERAFLQIDSTTLKKDKVLVVYLEDCHESLAGIIAGRIRERYHKPAFVATNRSLEGQDEMIKGSGRSIPAYSMFEEMTKCKELFIKFGGHPMAAGFSIQKENLEKLRLALNEKTTLEDENFVEKVTIDVPMPIDYVKESLIEEFKILQPFGKGNPKPLFAQQGLQASQVRILGQNRNVAKFKLFTKEGRAFDGVYFKAADVFAEYVKEHPEISITYYPEINEFNGRKSLQFVICNYK